MNPTENPATALGDGRYVHHPHQTGARIANRLDIEPTSTHLLVGGVGSGKSTELLEAQRLLQEAGDVVALFADVPSLESTKTPPRILLAVVAARLFINHFLSKKHAEDVKAAAQALKQTVIGRWVHSHEFYEDDDYYGDERWVSGLSSPVRVDSDVKELAELLARLSESSPAHLVVLLDGLDRMQDTDNLSRALATGAQLLEKAGIGVVVVGPQQLRYGQHRELTEEFSAFHVHAALDTTSQEGAAFLDSVLEQRTSEEFLPAATRNRLVEFSGGLLRDLVAIARSAGEEAYAAGAVSVETKHVDRAVDRFGRGRLLGVTQEMAKRLVEIRPRYGKAPKLTFTPATDLDIDLLLHGVLVEIASTPPRYIVHPTVEPLIPGLRRSA